MGFIFFTPSLTACHGNPSGVREVFPLIRKTRRSFKIIILRNDSAEWVHDTENWHVPSRSHQSWDPKPSSKCLSGLYRPQTALALGAMHYSAGWLYLKKINNKRLFLIYLSLQPWMSHRVFFPVLMSVFVYICRRIQSDVNYAICCLLYRYQGTS